MRPRAVFFRSAFTCAFLCTVTLELWLSASPAHAQPMDVDADIAALAAQGGLATPAAAQTYLLFELYAAQAQQLSTLPPAAQEELARRAQEYMTNGAEVAAVPTSGPGAAYYTNGAEVTAAVTTTIPSGLAPPTGSTVTAGLPSAAPGPAASAVADASAMGAPSASPTPPNAEPAPESSASADEGDAAALSPPPSPGTTRVDLPPRAAAATPMGTEINHPTSVPAAEVTASPETHDSGSGLGWLGPLLGGLGFGVLLGVIVIRLRAPPRPPTGWP